MRAYEAERTTHAKETTRRLLAVLVAAAMGLVPGPLNNVSAVDRMSQPAAQAAVVNPSPEMANPERGYMRMLDNCERADFTATQLRAYRVNRNMTLVQCVFYLNAYRETNDLNLNRGLTDPITHAPVSALKQVATYMKAARDAGVKIVWRFAYTKDDNAVDASLATVQTHIAQLAPIFNQYKGVVHVFQQGFIGQYGEGAYSTNFNIGTKNGPKNWPARNAVLRALLEKLPKSMFIQVRTPLMKLMFLAGDSANPDDYPKVNDPTTAPLTSAEAFTGTNKARIGHVNDCLLKNQSDAGTYRTKVIPAIGAAPERNLLKLDREYVQAESTFLPVGGETCGFQFKDVAKGLDGYEKRPLCGADYPGNSDNAATTSDADDNKPLAVSELKRFHWNYINHDKNDTVNGAWTQATGSGPCWQKVADNLGYRYKVSSKSLSVQQTATSRSITVTVGVLNQGWGTPVSSYRVKVLLSQPAVVGQPFLPARIVTVAADPRRWAPGTTSSFSAKINVTTLAAGKWDVSVILPDGVLGNRVGYGIRLKNAAWRDLDLSSDKQYFANSLTTYTAP